MSGVNLDNLFDDIEKLSDKISESEKKGGKSGGKSGGSGGQGFKNLDMVFIGIPTGSYELKVMVDSEGKLVEEVMLHTVKVGTGKATVNCKGEGCEICERVKKLDELKNKAAWKFSPYKLSKLLIKIGDVNEGGKGLEPGKVYAAYADEKFLKPLLDAIRTNKKYFKDDLVKMMTASENSPGFLVTASKAKKRSTFNFQFVQQISIPGVNIKEVFGTESFKNTSYGFFRNNFVNQKKFDEAVRMLDSLIVNTAKTTGTAPAGGGEGGNEGKQDPAPNTPANDNSQQQSSQDDNKSTGSETSSSTATEDKTPPVDQTPANDVVDQSQTPTGDIVINCKDVGEDGNPKCKGYFDPNNEMCSGQCQHKRDCLMMAMDAGRI
jgi:hypothetical protein